MYYRIYFQIPLCNEFIRETADDKLNERGFSAENIDKIKNYRNEARFLRALTYYHAMDLFGNVPFCDRRRCIRIIFSPNRFHVMICSTISKEN
ncbi:MAG: hypothetical protein IPG01_02400 [Chitinophagaceae bacterium]|nr:hypothetical protein [Chitinophagaceae bacterium]